MEFACDEHIEVAMDVVVDEYEAAPIIEKLNEADQLSTMCSYCKKPAVYSITK
ncbi:CxxH/CxxC protein [Alkalihalophilus pseudofirmus]|uniref:CxxH/CxxC protein n=1 Tax=Alkalihalophilus pseudofirmus TaxID=79885 RepID=A0AAJ2NRS2_ALKPS|nr:MULTISPECIES: CxxH/CxxC protein [Alkalihalophilus]MDV2887390.1 CxxH/CxxC protein [Alkalihalophilus pseudofirmus]MED1600511.1 CxxH/CxxC protein [Alkalihalophilus marmarensis]WEG16957.1 CxxH/CxxC protein [Alkalihalophilus pseudofirmus]